MKTIEINSYEYVRLNDVCDILRHIKEFEASKEADKFVDLMARLMFRKEVRAAKTKEEKEAVRELPGDFVVYNRLDHINENGKSMIFFKEYDDGEGIATDDGNQAMLFKYASKAQEIADNLKGDWKVMSVGREEGEMNREFLDALFSGDILEEGEEE